MDNFIIGMPKCATSAIYELLRSDHRFSVGTTKEINFYCKDIFSYKTNNINTHEDYVSLFDERKCCVDISVNYCFSDKAATEIHYRKSDAKVLLIMRDPISYVNSQFRQLKFAGYERSFDLETAFRREEKGFVNKYLPYATLLDYDGIIKRWSQHDLTVLKYEDVLQNPGLILNKFIDVDENITLPIVNESKEKKYGKYTYYFRKYSRLGRFAPKVVKDIMWKFSTAQNVSPNYYYSGVLQFDEFIQKAKKVYEEI